MLGEKKQQYGTRSVDVRRTDVTSRQTRILLSAQRHGRNYFSIIRQEQATNTDS